MKSFYTIIRPVVTEKATKLGDKMTYVFYVHPKATKISVKMAIKDIFGEDVDSVRMMISPAKTKQIRRATINKRPEMKKALVILKGRKKLDVTKLAKESGKKEGSVKVSKKEPVKKTVKKTTAKKQS